MKIGLTFDLKSEYIKQGFSPEEAAEFDSEETVEGIEKALVQLGYKTDRIGNFKQLVQRINHGDRWDLVFNIAEGIYGFGREAQVPALLDAYRIPYVFSDPLVLSLTLHKGMTKRIIRDNHIPTADFVIVSHIRDVENVHLDYPLFAKPVAEGTGKGITKKSLTETPDELRVVCKQLLKRFNQSVLVEEYLPGREFTVGIVGTGEEARVIGVIEIILNQKAERSGYSYLNKAHYQDRVEYVLVEEEMERICSEIALKAWQALECRDGGRVDLRCDKNNNPQFMEINPLAGLNYLDSDLPIIAYKNGYTFADLIRMIMESALRRVKK